MNQVNHKSFEFPVRTITLEEAIADGWTPSGLRACANSLERIMRSKGTFDHTYVDMYGTERTVTLKELQNFYPDENFRNVRALRTLAKMLERVKN